MLCHWSWDGASPRPTTRHTQSSHGWLNKALATAKVARTLPFTQHLTCTSSSALSRLRCIHWKISGNSCAHIKLRTTPRWLFELPRWHMTGLNASACPRRACNDVDGVYDPAAHANGGAKHFVSLQPVTTGDLDCSKQSRRGRGGRIPGNVTQDRKKDVDEQVLVCSLHGQNPEQVTSLHLMAILWASRCSCSATSRSSGVRLHSPQQGTPQAVAG